MAYPEWSMFLRKSKENLEATTMLYERGFYGLAAYHAQQSIEILFKSFAFQILRKHKEYNRVHLHAHLPINEVIGLVSNFVEKIERKIAEKKKRQGRKAQVSKDLKDIVIRTQEMKETFYRFKDIIRKIDNGKNTDRALKEDVWKFSLGLSVKDDSELNGMVAAANSYGAELSQDRFMEDMIHMAQFVFSNIDSINETENDKKYYAEIRPLMTHVLTAEGFPSATLAKMLNGKTLDSSDRSDLREFVIARGEFDTLALFFRYTGLLSAILEVARRFYPKTYEITEQYFDLQRITYASSICATLILLYPHEEYGRYPKNMADTTTEAVYAEKADKIKKYIAGCVLAYDRLVALM